MAGERQETTSGRSRERIQCAVVAGLCALMLLFAVAPAALASAPATGQYTLHVPSSGAKGDAAVGSKVGDSGGGSSALPVLLVGGAAVAGGVAAVGYFRWRRREGTA